MNELIVLGQPQIEPNANQAQVNQQFDQIAAQFSPTEQAYFKGISAVPEAPQTPPLAVNQPEMVQMAFPSAVYGRTRSAEGELSREQEKTVRHLGDVAFKAAARGGAFVGVAKLAADRYVDPNARGLLAAEQAAAIQARATEATQQIARQMEENNKKEADDDDEIGLDGKKKKRKRDYGLVA